MAIALKVNQVEKSDQPLPHQQVKSIAGRARELVWQHTQEQAIGYIEAGLFSYFVQKNSRVLRLVVGQASDGKSI